MRPRRSAYPQLRLAPLAFALLVGAAALSPAQAQRVSTDDPWCERQRGDDRPSACEVRTYTLGGRDRFVVDAGDNGGIRVEAWDRPDAELRALVRAEAPGEAAARRLVADTEVETGQTIRADVPDGRRNEHVSVSFELRVPRRSGLALTAHNGGIGITGVTGDVAFRTHNGGVSLVGVGGDVRGETLNGGLSVELAGRTWEGRGLDVQTTNGGVRLRVPDGYSAELETGTVNGALRVDLPGVQQRGWDSDRVTATLGRGGPRLRVTTENGGVIVGRN